MCHAVGFFSQDGRGGGVVACPNIGPTLGQRGRSYVYLANLLLRFALPLGEYRKTAEGP